MAYNFQISGVYDIQFDNVTGRHQSDSLTFEASITGENDWYTPSQTTSYFDHNTGLYSVNIQDLDLPMDVKVKVTSGNTGGIHPATIVGEDYINVDAPVIGGVQAWSNQNILVSLLVDDIDCECDVDVTFSTSAECGAEDCGTCEKADYTITTYTCLDTGFCTCNCDEPVYEYECQWYQACENACAYGCCGSDCSMAFHPQTTEELQTAVDLWINDEATALETYCEINTWDTSLITDMSNLFSYQFTFNDDISNWDVSSVMNMSQMFYYASSFNGDISSWDVSSVTNMSLMFEGTSSFSNENKCAIHTAWNYHEAWPYDWSEFCISGCTDPAACNYNESAYYEDGSCAYEVDCAGECLGNNICDCTDPFGLNYNPDATSDDGSCYYCEGANPQGCLYTGCPADQECIMINCNPSYCECIEEFNQWMCYDDCDGGVCVNINDFEAPLGDINYDSVVNVTDIVYMVNLILEDLEPSADELWAADMNGDGLLNIVDVVLIVADILNSEPETVTDIDGNVYTTVQIGDQLWMAENLKVTHYNNGDLITHITNNGDWGSYDEGQYGVYNNDPTNADIYGNLYNWSVVDDERGVCPEGWHVPTDDEWKELEMFLGMSQSEADDTGWRGTNEGSKLAGNADLWNDGNLESNDEFGTSGFNGFPSGFRSYNSGNYGSIGSYGYFWSSSEYGSNSAWSRKLGYGGTDVYRNGSNKRSGFSVRCVRN